MGNELIYVSLISGIFGVIITQLLSYNYFKRENFKYDLGKKKKADTLQFQELRKELGLKGKTKTAPQENTNNLEPLIKAGIDAYLNRGDEIEEIDRDETITDKILEVAKDHPELVSTLLEKFTGGKNDIEAFRTQE